MVIIGYTHYWSRPAEIPQDKFDKIQADVRKVVDACNEIGIRIRGGMGEGEPIITTEEIVFNGDALCGHQKRDLGITWPSENAGGFDDKGTTDGDWFAGAKLNTRTCGGDCSHETFHLPRVDKENEWHKMDENGFYGGFTKTAYKPYDVAVTAALIIVKHYLEDNCEVSSDGRDRDWFDGKMLCDKLFGYGLGYALNDETRNLSKIAVPV